jgi:hypothetical protein
MWQSRQAVREGLLPGAVVQRLRLFPQNPCAAFAPRRHTAGAVLQWLLQLGAVAGEERCCSVSLLEALLLAPHPASASATSNSLLCASHPAGRTWPDTPLTAAQPRSCATTTRPRPLRSGASPRPQRAARSNASGPRTRRGGGRGRGQDMLKSGIACPLHSGVLQRAACRAGRNRRRLASEPISRARVSHGTGCMTDGTRALLSSALRSRRHSSTPFFALLEERRARSRVNRVNQVNRVNRVHPYLVLPSPGRQRTLC